MFGWVAAGLGLTGLALASGGGSSPVTAASAESFPIGGALKFGALVSAVRVDVLPAGGERVASGMVEAPGDWAFNLPDSLSATPLLIIEAFDVNAGDVDYLDPFTGQPRSIDTSLRAFMPIVPIPASGADAAFSGFERAHISVLTELFVRLLQPSQDQTALDPVVLREARSAYANLWGLNSSQISVEPARLAATEGWDASLASLSDASAAAGLVLLEFAALQAALGASLPQLLDVLDRGIERSDAGWQLNASLQDLLRQARTQVSDRLVTLAMDNDPATAPSLSESAMRVLGRPVVEAQAVLPDQTLRVSGRGEPGRSLTLSYSGGPSVTAESGENGEFSLTLPLPEPIMRAAPVLTWTDALDRVIGSFLTLPPIVESSNGSAVSGFGRPGERIEILTADGRAIARTVVDALGFWRVSIPEAGLSEGQPWAARSISALGEASAAAAVPFDPASLAFFPRDASAGAVWDGILGSDELDSIDAIRIDLLGSLDRLGAVAGDVQLYLPDGRVLPAELGPVSTTAGRSARTVALTPELLTLEGRYALEVGQAGLTSGGTRIEFLVDRQAPLPPSDLRVSGALISGRVEPGAALFAFDAQGNLLRQQFVDSYDGSFAFDFEGIPVARLSALDRAGQMSPQVSLPPDLGVPVIMTALDRSGIVRGAVPSGQVVDERQPTLLGRLSRPLAEGESIEVWRGQGDSAGQRLGLAEVDGSWISFQDGLESALADGSYWWTFRLLASGVDAVPLISNRFALTVDPDPLELLSLTVESDLLGRADIESDLGVPITIVLGEGVQIGDLLWLSWTLPGGQVVDIYRPIGPDQSAGSILSEFLMLGESAGFEGEHQLLASLLTGRNGLAGAVRTTTFELDLTAPWLEGGVVGFRGELRGPPPEVEMTSNRAPLFIGLTEPNAEVEVVLEWHENEEPLRLTVRADELGQWQVSWPNDRPLADGRYEPVAIAVDPAGNRLVQPLRPFVVDTVLEPPTAQLSPGSDTGALDGVTSMSRPTFLGTAEPGARVILGFRRGSEILPIEVQTYADPIDGSWVVDLADPNLFLTSGDTIAPLLDGTYTLRVSVRDLAGNQGTVDGPLFTIDTTAPNRPVITFAIGQLAEDNAFNGGSIADRQPTLFIRSDSNLLVRVFDQLNAELGVAPPLAEGTAGYIYKPAEPLDPGPYTFLAFASDLAGNISLPSLPFLLTVL